jgi:hypothetical protein
MSADDYDRIVFAARTREPSVLTLNVISNWDHFAGGVLAKALRLVGVTVRPFDNHTAVIDPNQAYLAWDPFMNLALEDDLRARLSPIRIINGKRPNTEKGHIKSVFASVFGYSFDVDPTSYTGMAAAKKGADNGSHSGKTVHCPIDVPEPGYTYDRLIANDFGDANGETFVVDLRTVIVDGAARLVYGKLRPLANRYANLNSYARTLTPGEVFSPAELRLIEAFCREIKLDYGEIDILRDRIDGRIYVVDVNNTPYGPPNYLRNGEGDVALRIIADLATRSFWPSCEVMIRKVARKGSVATP